MGDEKYPHGWLYAIERMDGKEVAVASTRHEARGFISEFRGGKREWYDIVPINPISLLWWNPRMECNGWGPHPGVF